MKKPTYWWVSGGGAAIRTLVLPVLTIKDYTFRLEFFILSKIFGSYFDIVTNNCVEFTYTTVAL